MQALPAVAPPAPRRQMMVGATVASMAITMLVGGMLGVWALQRSRAIDAEGAWLPDGVVIPEVPTNVMLVAFVPLCVFAQWAVWSAKRGDHPHTGLALAGSAFIALLIINAQAFVWVRLGFGVGDGPYQAMFYALTGVFVVLMVAGMLFSVIAMFRYLGGRFHDREILTAHAIFWYAMSAAFAAIWFAVYVTK